MKIFLSLLRLVHNLFKGYVGTVVGTLVNFNDYWEFFCDYTLHNRGLGEIGGFIIPIHQ